MELLQFAVSDRSIPISQLYFRLQSKPTITTTAATTTATVTGSIIDTTTTTINTTTTVTIYYITVVHHILVQVYIFHLVPRKLTRKCTESSFWCNDTFERHNVNLNFS